MRFNYHSQHSDVSWISVKELINLDMYWDTMLSYHVEEMCDNFYITVFYLIL